MIDGAPDRLVVSFFVAFLRLSELLTGGLEVDTLFVTESEREDLGFRVQILGLRV